MLAKAGIHLLESLVDARLRGHDRCFLRLLFVY